MAGKTIWNSQFSYFIENYQYIFSNCEILLVYPWYPLLWAAHHKSYPGIKTTGQFPQEARVGQQYICRTWRYKICKNNIYSQSQKEKFLRSPCIFWFWKVWIAGFVILIIQTIIYHEMLIQSNKCCLIVLITNISLFLKSLHLPYPNLTKKCLIVSKANES